MRVVFLTLIYVCFALNVQAADVRLQGTVIAKEDLSAIALLGNDWVVGGDEADSKDRNILQQFTTKGVWQANFTLLEGDEMDIEGLAVDGRTIYAIGSHAAKRKKLKANKSLKRNQRMLRADQILPQPARDWLYRLDVDQHGELTARSAISLRGVIANHPVLGVFSHLPSKENGVDIEGLGVRNGLLYAGFRGPVLRGGMTPVLRFDAQNVMASARLLLVSLDGLGIRGMTEVDHGFLLLAGPVNDARGPFAIYYWDGEDMTPGKKRKGVALGQARLLRQLPKDICQGNPEALALSATNAKSYRLLMLCDGEVSTVHQFRLPRH